MEIEKTRETSWRIQLKNRDENIEITSVEISGEVRLIKLAILNQEKSVKVEMNKEEFYNFLSLISAFKDVVIGEEPIFIGEEEEDLREDAALKLEEDSSFDGDSYEVSTRLLEKEDEEDENDNIDKLNPEEWDPW
ncbi:MAG: hypothetical protein ACXAAI_11045 [Promethearchaeota archaeon]|jgi:hypothetical protein